MTTNQLPDNEYCTNRTEIVLKAKNGQKQTYVVETLMPSEKRPNALRRIGGGGSGFSKKYFFSSNGPDCEANFAKWTEEKGLK